MTKTCPSCEKKALRSRQRTNDYRCGACGETFDKSDLGEMPVQPGDPVDEDHCPHCDRKALSLRVRTDDFRCSACGEVVPRELITLVAMFAYELRLYTLMRLFTRRVVPRVEPMREVARTTPEYEDTFMPGAGCGFVALVLGAAACVASFQLLESLGVVMRIVLGLVAGIAGNIAIYYVIVAREKAADEARHARAIEQAEAKFRDDVAAAGTEHEQRVATFERWKDEHPAVKRLLEEWAKLNELSEQDDDDEGDEGVSEQNPAQARWHAITSFSKLSNDVRETWEAAIKDVGTPDERRLFSRLREEIVKRMPVENRAVRSKVTKKEAASSKAAIHGSFPEDVAEEVLAMDLHPEDVSRLIHAFEAAMIVNRSRTNPSDVIEGLSSWGYLLEFDKIDPPEKINIHGKVIDFATLTRPAQAEALVHYRVHVLAASLAARQRITDTLVEAGLRAAPSKVISDAMLRVGSNESDTLDAERACVDSADDGDSLDDESVRSVLTAVGDNPIGKRLVSAYVQATRRTEGASNAKRPNARRR